MSTHVRIERAAVHPKPILKYYRTRPGRRHTFDTPVDRHSAAVPLFHLYETGGRVDQWMLVVVVEPCYSGSSARKETHNMS
ncbi:hypothetical protein GWI33_012750 [Rhynchophorus ferrugineus]|uniref:Uncharacterized protein n=1 Tax=Rhynchophorus ferrugineus TaxID=354439 RepID=A0A834MN23_RHYFE|nr:hypothetical protein GWI33_012750 [Rhynchophorus ferrugineus]